MPYVNFAELTGEKDINYISHYGTPHEGYIPHSGRYEFGSGDNPFQHQPFLNLAQQIRALRAQGMSDTDIAEKLWLVDIDKKDPKPSTKKLREIIAYAKEQEMWSNCTTARRLYTEQLEKHGKANVSAIARQMGVSEANVRSWLAKTPDDYSLSITNTAEFLKNKLETERFIDVGAGVENTLNITDEKLDAAITLLKEMGYHQYYLTVDQPTTNYKTTITCLARPEDSWSDLAKNQDQISTIVEYTPDDGKTIWVPEYPKALDSDRVYIRYAEDGGIEKDGVIELRQGVKDLSLTDVDAKNETHYAQVRINVDDNLYLKGMAMYSDEIPEGYDVVFNTNKSKDVAFEDVLKPLKRDKRTNEIIEDNPFGATIKAKGQVHYIDENGESQLGVINKVNEEGDWDKWSRTISSQMLSKQPQELIKKQLDLTVAEKQDEFDEIRSISNPVIRSKFLEDFGDNCDKSAADLKATGFPGQSSHVILPITTLSEKEIYAPNYETGQKVALIRYPHAGTFEIPVLTVNNKHQQSRKLLGDASDAVGINAKVAEQLSGADFDGDSVLVIPVAGGAGNSKVTIQTRSYLEGLKNFNPKEQYKLPDSAPKMKSSTKQTQMGIITNLITDMSFQNPTEEELTRAVKHSMVIIDAEKHHLNYKQSAEDNRIAELQAKYQPAKEPGKNPGGASSLLSQAGSETYIDERQPYSTIDKETGERVYKTTGKEHEVIKKLKNEKGEVIAYQPTGEMKPNQTKIKKMYTVKDANELVSVNKHPTEMLYANYANSMKSMANSARKESVNNHTKQYSKEASIVYAEEVKSLAAKMEAVRNNAPKERMAVLYANQMIAAEVQKDPGIKNDKEHYKRLKNQKMSLARAKYSSNKKAVQIKPTEKEWEAMNSGALSNNALKSVINNMDKDVLRDYAMPKAANKVSDSKIARMKAMKATGFYTTAEIAKACGVSVSTVKSYVTA